MCNSKCKARYTSFPLPIDQEGLTGAHFRNREEEEERRSVRTIQGHKRGDRDVGREGLLPSFYGQISDGVVAISPTLEHCIPIKTQRKAFFFNEMEGVTQQAFSFPCHMLHHHHTLIPKQEAVCADLAGCWSNLAPFALCFAKIRYRARFHKSHICHFCATNKLQQNILLLSFIWN